MRAVAVALADLRQQALELLHVARRRVAEWRVGSDSGAGFRRTPAGRPRYRGGARRRRCRRVATGPTSRPPPHCRRGRRFPAPARRASPPPWARGPPARRARRPRAGSRAIPPGRGRRRCRRCGRVRRGGRRRRPRLGGARPSGGLASETDPMSPGGGLSIAEGAIASPTRASAVSRGKGASRLRRFVSAPRGGCGGSKRAPAPTAAGATSGAGSATSKAPPVGDQSRELLQRPDLVGNDPPHCVGGFACLLWQIEDAAAQLLARLVELALNLARHLSHFIHRLAESAGGVFESAGELGVGLLEGRLQRLCGPLALLGRGVANGLELAGDGDRGAPCGRGEGGADLLGASLRPGETVLDVGGKPPSVASNASPRRRKIADQRFEARMALFKRDVQRPLLFGQIAPTPPSVSACAASWGRARRLGLGRAEETRPSVATCPEIAESARWNSSTRVGEPALDCRKPVAGRADRVVDDRARMAEVVDQPASSSRSRSLAPVSAPTEFSAVRRDGLAQRGARTPRPGRSAVSAARRSSRPTASRPPRRRLSTPRSNPRPPRAIGR